MDLPTIASLLLGVAFVVAGGSKIAAGTQWPIQARDLRAPSLVIPALPWIEIVVGAMLIVQVGKPVPALIALGLLVAFTALIVRLLQLGRRPACACFGAWSAKPIGSGHLARNGALMALAVIALF